MNFKFKKKYGQNFLKDKNILQNIVKKSEVDKETLVIEIGVGAAALTNYLADQAGFVVGYEIDNELKEIIANNLKTKKNVDIIFDDFLNRNLVADLKKYEYKKIYVVANLPYYITTPIIEKIINSKIPVEKIVVMVQKEVGDRFSAKVGSKDYNSLTIFLNYYFAIKKIIDVSRNCFIPAPNVDSVVVEMKKREKKIDVKNEELFFYLVRDSFKFKRKNLRNNLKNYNLEKINAILNQKGLDLSVRAEKLTIADFVDISNYISE